MIFIKDVQNAKKILEKIVSQIKNQVVNKTVFNPESDHPLATGNVIKGNIMEKIMGFMMMFMLMS